MGTDAHPEELPSGQATFLFTDIQGSTKRWEADPDGMRLALASHDAVLVSAIEPHGGRLFKHTGDGMVAAFASAPGAVRAAVDAQRRLELPVRMGLATGEAHAEGNDYFGPPLNRAARVMASGHGGQILVAGSTAILVGGIDGIELIDLGSRRLRDLSEPVQIYQVGADGLGKDFPPLRTVDTVPGNLPVPSTSLVGRDAQVDELAALVGDRRLVTLTGVGGVGKTRLSIRLAAELSLRFPDGVWLVELAPVADPAAVPDAVATALGITPLAGMTVLDSVVLALSGRRLLLVLDNCEHVLDAAARVVEAVLARSSTVTVVATSREPLGVAGEHTWPVPPLDVAAGAGSASVTLFVERAKAATPDFSFDDPATVDAVTEICRRLDGIALAIELAAARMVSLSAEEVRDRLGERFRLLSGGRRGPERHQTLWQAIAWSYDLLSDDERRVLECCSVFADGFDLRGLVAVHGNDDEFEVLDLVEGLVRRSLVVVERQGGRTRYRVLETIRQFGEDRLAASGRVDEVRDAHARFFREQVANRWAGWDGPGQRAELDWLDVEFANLRAAFRRAADRGDVGGAATIASHVAVMIWPLQRFEPVGWALEILERAVAGNVVHLPRLYVAASLCLYLGEPDRAVGYARTATALRDDPGFEPFEDGWSEMLESLAHLFGGRIERRVEVSADLARRTGFARVVGLCGLTWALPAVGRADEAMAIADETVDAARRFGNPFWIGWALGGYGRAFAEREPLRALGALRDGLAYAREHRLGFWQANLAQDAARLEASHGDLDDALELFSASIDSFHRAGNVVFLAATLASLAVFFDRVEQHEIAAVVYGASSRQASIGLVPNLGDVVANLRSVLGDHDFARLTAEGMAFETAEAVRYAQAQIQRIADGGVHAASSDDAPHVP